MVTFLLGAVFLIAVAVALVALSVIVEGARYDKWCETYNESAIEWPADVMDGERVVMRTHLIERRANRQ
jgi:hypothetical protein